MTFGLHNRKGLVVGVDHPHARVHRHATNRGADEQNLPGCDASAPVRRTRGGFLPEPSETLQRTDLTLSLRVYAGGSLRYVGDL